MAKFDKSKDENLFKEAVQIGEIKFLIGVYSYDGNAPKVQISRMRKNDQSEHGWSFAKLGRLTKDELTDVLPVLEKALENMQ